MFIPLFFLFFFLCCCFSRHTGKKRNSNHFSFISDVRYMCGSSGWSRRGCENGIESLNCVKKRRVGEDGKKWWMENTTVERRVVEKCYAVGVLSSSLWCCFCFSFKKDFIHFQVAIMWWCVYETFVSTLLSPFFSHLPTIWKCSLFKYVFIYIIVVGTFMLLLLTLQ